eukprot:Hpha_TRINITY_DN16141_c1_g3::TRINITY_DN16141_c1_g3_i1::g.6015::m.6015
MHGAQRPVLHKVHSYLLPFQNQAGHGSARSPLVECYHEQVTRPFRLHFVLHLQQCRDTPDDCVEGQSARDPIRPVLTPGVHVFPPRLPRLAVPRAMGSALRLEALRPGLGSPRGTKDLALDGEGAGLAGLTGVRRLEKGAIRACELARHSDRVRQLYRTVIRDARVHPKVDQAPCLGVVITQRVGSAYVLLVTRTVRFSANPDLARLLGEPTTAQLAQNIRVQSTGILAAFGGIPKDGAGRRVAMGTDTVTVDGLVLVDGTRAAHTVRFNILRPAAVMGALDPSAVTVPKRVRFTSGSLSGAGGVLVDVVPHKAPPRLHRPHRSTQQGCSPHPTSLLICLSCNAAQ